MYGSCKLFV